MISVIILFCLGTYPKYKQEKYCFHHIVNKSFTTVQIVSVLKVATLLSNALRNIIVAEFLCWHTHFPLLLLAASYPWHPLHTQGNKNVIHIY